MLNNEYKMIFRPGTPLVSIIDDTQVWVLKGYNQGNVIISREMDNVEHQISISQMIAEFHCGND